MGAVTRVCSSCVRGITAGRLCGTCRGSGQVAVDEATGALLGGYGSVTDDARKLLPVVPVSPEMLAIRQKLADDAKALAKRQRRAS